MGCRGRSSADLRREDLLLDLRDDVSSRDISLIEKAFFELYLRGDGVGTLMLSVATILCRAWLKKPDSGYQILGRVVLFFCHSGH